MRNSVINNFSRTLVIMVLLSHLFGQKVHSSPPMDYEVSVEEEQNGVFTIEFTIKNFYVIQNTNGTQSIIVNGLHSNPEIGKPQLPVHGLIINIPAFATFGVSLLDEKVEVIDNFIPIQNELQEPLNSNSFFSNSSQNSAYSQGIISLKYLGFMREQYLLHILLQPFQFDEDQKILTIHKQIQVKLTPQNSSTRLKNYNSGLLQQHSNAISLEDDDLFGEIVSSVTANKTIRKLDTDNLQRKAKQDGLSDFGSVEFYKKHQQHDRFKVTVTEEGIYKLTYDALAKAGIPVQTLNPNDVQVFNVGQKMPIHIIGGEDNTFDSDDLILFYGQANTSLFTEENIYWLIITQDETHKMAIKENLREENLSEINLISQKRRFEKNLEYKPDLLYAAESKDNWKWRALQPNSKSNFEFELQRDLSSLQDPKIKFLFYCDNIDGYAVRLLVNNVEIFRDRKTEPGDLLVHIPLSKNYLQDGSNTLTIETGSSKEAIYIDWFEVEYSGNISATDNSVKFTNAPDGIYQIKIDGFTNDSIYVFEIEDSTKINLISELLIKRTGNSFALNLRTHFKANNNYICLDATKFKVPKSILRVDQSNLNETNQSSDYLMITHASLYDELIPLNNFHRENGLLVTIVTVDKIYDEFNYGIFSPRAIKDFLQYVYYHWQKPVPTYVLLAGDATYDYKNYLALKGFVNLVPTHMFENGYRKWQSANDNWFVTVSGDDIVPDMLIGRLPVKSNHDLKNVVDKIISYGNSYTRDSWKKNVVLVSDNEDPESNANFDGVSDLLAAQIPNDYNIKKLYLSSSDHIGSKVKKQVNRSFNSGAFSINYSGHGAINRWAKEELLTTSDIDFLSNEKKFPFVSALTCLTGAFETPLQDCVAEQLINKENGGAIGTLAATGWIYISHYGNFGQSLFNKLFQPQELEFGRIILDAKLDYLSNGGLSDHFEMITYLGDPALKATVIHPDAPTVEIQGNSQLNDKSDKISTSERPSFKIIINSKHPLNLENINIQVDETLVDLNNPNLYLATLRQGYTEFNLETDFETGQHTIMVTVEDSLKLKGQTSLTFFIQEEPFRFQNVLNYPNPMDNFTHFTFELSRPAQITIKIYTISGRLIHTIEDNSYENFTAIEWDGRDSDGDRIANGVYLYKITAKNGNESEEFIGKLAKVR